MGLLKTRGIVLHHIKYGDSSIITTIYTELHGRQSYMVNGVHSKKSKFRQAIFQPLSLLEMEVYFKNNRDIQRIKEAKPLAPFINIPQDMIKTSICLFLAEILYKTLYEEESNAPLFNFLFKSIELLETETVGIENFHIFFLVKYSRFLGILPDIKKLESDVYFDLRDGYFTGTIPFHGIYLDTDDSNILSDLLSMGYEDLHRLKISNIQRKKLLEQLIEFYYIHIDKMGEIKSHQILKEVFH